MSEIALHVIGCGDAFGSGARFHTCFFVKSPLHNFLIDCGATSVHGLKQSGISTNDIDTIIITHFHGDHYGGIPFFLLDATFLTRRTKPLTIITPYGGHATIKALTALLYPGNPEIIDGLDLTFLEYSIDEILLFNGLSIQAFPAIHTKESLPHSLRITVYEKVIAYSGDTEWNDLLPAVADNADLFICESCWFDFNGKGHISYFTLREKKKLLNCRSMLLTHMSESTLEHLEEIKADFACASDGLIIKI